MLKLNKDLPKARAAPDGQIDQLVYELYGLTEVGVEACVHASRLV
jgi:phage tail protein X